MTGFALAEVVLDRDGRPVDYRFLELNPAFEKLTGLKASEVVGRTVTDAIPGIFGVGPDDDPLRSHEGVQGGPEPEVLGR